MLESHVVVHALCFVLRGSERKSLQSSSLQQQYMEMNTWSELILFVSGFITDPHQ